MTNPASPHLTAKNGLATGGFVLALCAVVFFWLPVVAQIVWLLGLIFSAVGLAKARKTKGRPRFGLAVAGLVISLAGAALGVLFFFGLVAAGIAGGGV